jgi:putative FmdB family regulatory protein
MYEYKCAHCGKRFEALQKFSDAPLTVHEECGSGPVERLVSAPSFNFKGTGWYVTDYAKGNGAKPDGSSSPAGAAKDSKSDSKQDSKPDSKQESHQGSKPDSKPAASSSAPAAAPAPAASTSSSSSGSDKSSK